MNKLLTKGELTTRPVGHFTNFALFWFGVALGEALCLWYLM